MVIKLITDPKFNISLAERNPKSISKNENKKILGSEFDLDPSTRCLDFPTGENHL